MRLITPSLLALMLSSVALTACHDEHHDQTLGQKLDNLGTKTRDTVDPPRGPAEKAGRSLDRTFGN